MSGRFEGKVAIVAGALVDNPKDRDD